MDCEGFNQLNISLKLFYLHFNVVVRYIIKLWCGLSCSVKIVIVHGM